MRGSITPGASLHALEPRRAERTLCASPGAYRRTPIFPNPAFCHLIVKAAGARAGGREKPRTYKTGLMRLFGVDSQVEPYISEQAAELNDSSRYPPLSLSQTKAKLLAAFDTHGAGLLRSELPGGPGHRCSKLTSY